MIKLLIGLFFTLQNPLQKQLQNYAYCFNENKSLNASLSTQENYFNLLFWVSIENFNTSFSGLNPFLVITSQDTFTLNFGGVNLNFHIYFEDIFMSQIDSRNSTQEQIQNELKNTVYSFKKWVQVRMSFDNSQKILLVIIGQNSNKVSYNQQIDTQNIIMTYCLSDFNYEGQIIYDDIQISSINMMSQLTHENPLQIYGYFYFSMNPHYLRTFLPNLIGVDYVQNLQRLRSSLKPQITDNTSFIFYEQSGFSTKIRHKNLSDQSYCIYMKVETDFSKQFPIDIRNLIYARKNQGQSINWNNSYKIKVILKRGANNSSDTFQLSSSTDTLSFSSNSTDYYLQIVVDLRTEQNNILRRLTMIQEYQFFGMPFQKTKILTINDIFSIEDQHIFFVVFTDQQYVLIDYVYHIKEMIILNRQDTNQNFIGNFPKSFTQDYKRLSPTNTYQIDYGTNPQDYNYCSINDCMQCQSDGICESCFGMKSLISNQCQICPVGEEYNSILQDCQGQLSEVNLEFESDGKLAMKTIIELHNKLYYQNDKFLIFIRVEINSKIFQSTINTLQNHLYPIFYTETIKKITNQVRTWQLKFKSIESSSYTAYMNQKYVDECLTEDTPFSQQLALFDSQCLSQCPEGFYYDSNNVCVSCVQNCSICIAFNQCLKCQENHILYEGSCYHSQIHLCHLRDPYCAECSPETFQCVNCINTHYVHRGICKFKCRYNAACSSCNQDHSCQSCNTGYYLKQNECIRDCMSEIGVGVCDQEANFINNCVGGFEKESNFCRKNGTTLMNCVETSGSDCIQCRRGFFIDNGSCQRQCIVDKRCVTCDVDESVCQSCVVDHFVNGEGKCEMNCLLRDQNCLICQSLNTHQCQQCKPNYFLNNQGICLKSCLLQDLNCENCLPSNPLICQKCKIFHILKDQSCIREDCISNDPNALNCSLINPLQAISCKNQHFLRDGFCYPLCHLTDPLCHTCNPIYFEKCLKCLDFHSLKGDQCEVNCTFENPKALLCDSENPQKIIKCKEPYELINEKCEIQCPQNCLICNFSSITQNVECQECQNSYQLNESSEKCLPSQCHEEFCIKCQSWISDECQQCLKCNSENTQIISTNEGTSIIMTDQNNQKIYQIPKIIESFSTHDKFDILNFGNSKIVVLKCPPNHYLENNYCQPDNCPFGCLECYRGKCSQCHQEFQLENFGCVYVGNGEFPQENQENSKCLKISHQVKNHKKIITIDIDQGVIVSQDDQDQFYEGYRECEGENCEGFGEDCQEIKKLKIIELTNEILKIKKLSPEMKCPPDSSNKDCSESEKCQDQECKERIINKSCSVQSTEYLCNQKIAYIEEKEELKCEICQQGQIFYCQQSLNCRKKCDIQIKYKSYNSLTLSYSDAMEWDVRSIESFNRKSKVDLDILNKSIKFSKIQFGFETFKIILPVEAVLLSTQCSFKENYTTSYKDNDFIVEFEKPKKTVQQTLPVVYLAVSFSFYPIFQYFVQFLQFNTFFQRFKKIKIQGGSIYEFMNGIVGDYEIPSLIRSYDINYIPSLSSDYLINVMYLILIILFLIIKITKFHIKLFKIKIPKLKLEKKLKKPFLIKIYKILKKMNFLEILEKFLFNMMILEYPKHLKIFIVTNYEYLKQEKLYLLSFISITIFLLYHFTKYSLHILSYKIFRTFNVFQNRKLKYPNKILVDYQFKNLSLQFLILLTMELIPQETLFCFVLIWTTLISFMLSIFQNTSFFSFHLTAIKLLPNLFVLIWMTLCIQQHQIQASKNSSLNFFYILANLSKLVEIIYFFWYQKKLQETLKKSKK